MSLKSEQDNEPANHIRDFLQPMLSRRAFGALAFGGLAATTTGRWDSAAAAAGGFSEAGLTRMAEVLSGHVNNSLAAGIVTLVSRGGQVRVEALGVQDLVTKTPMRRDTIFRGASIGKPVTAAAAMILVEEGKVGLEDPVDKFLPELADRKVLKTLESPLEDTVPAKRAITLRDLLTLRAGIGAVMVFPPKYPIQMAMQEVGVSPSADLFREPPDEFMKRIGSLPLVQQPGDVWLYHTGMDIAGVLIARAAGKSLGEFMKERLFEPLGMKDTDFYVPEDKLDRLATMYREDETGKPVIMDEAKGGLFSKPSAFEAGGGGLVYTVDDYHAFCRMMIGKGEYLGKRILSARSVEEMTTDQIPPEQKANSPFFPGFWDNRGWGLGLSILKDPGDPSAPGRFGWDGGYGTSAYWDPKEGLAGILMTQQLMQSPSPTATYTDFWKLAYEAIDRGN